MDFCWIPRLHDGAHNGSIGSDARRGSSTLVCTWSKFQWWWRASDSFQNKDKRWSCRYAKIFPVSGVPGSIQDKGVHFYSAHLTGSPKLYAARHCYISYLLFLSCPRIVPTCRLPIYWNSADVSHVDCWHWRIGIGRIFWGWNLVRRCFIVCIGVGTIGSWFRG